MSCLENLNKNLQAALALHVNAKFAHWNVRGPGFFSIHKLFDDLQAAALDWADTMAEQVGYMEEEAQGTAKQAANSYLGPYKVGVADEKAHVNAILEQLEKFEEKTRKAIDDALEEGDQPVADIFIEVTRGACKYIYLFQSHLK